MDQVSRALMVAGGNAAATPTYVEDVFSTYLYTGNGSTQTINNGIDLAGKGGLVWIKCRSLAFDHALFDTLRGSQYGLSTDTTAGQTYSSTNSDLTSFDGSGFSLGSGYYWALNNSSRTFASWTFRKAPKFFDVVTYTGNGTTNNVAHSLGVAPDFILLKATSTTSDWAAVAKSSNGSYFTLQLNATSAALFNPANLSGSSVTSGSIAVNTISAFTSGAQYNTNGVSYVAYLFAHDPAADGLIQCGSYIGNGSTSGPIVTLGWEPQWLMIKNVSGTGFWQIIDNMRGMPVGSADATLQANNSAAETSTDYVSPTATGFQVTSTSSEVNNNAATYIYIAIRRGPMRTPTTGTSVYSALAYSGDQTNNRILSQGTAGPADLFWFMNRNFGANSFSPTGLYSPIYDRLRGITVSNTSVAVQCRAVATPFANAEGNCYSFTLADTQTNFSVSGGQGQLNYTNDTVLHMFRRAPGFFDEVCYTGTGSANTVSLPHNLKVAPELMIYKRRDGDSGWVVYSEFLGPTKYLRLQSDAVPDQSSPTSAIWGDTAPTSSVFTVGGVLNPTGGTQVMYFFASLPGISKVGSYTGNGTSQTINCGFTTGARFVLIKRTDSTGDWYVWDTARGIVSANDPHLSLNTTAAEVTGNDSIDPDSTGFIVNQVAATNINVNTATYIYLAIA